MNPQFQDYSPDLPPWPGETGAGTMQDDFILPEVNPYAEETMPEDPSVYYALAQETLATLPARLETQEQVDALPRWLKEVLLLKQQGIPLMDSDVVKFAAEGLRQDRRMQQKPTTGTVKDPITGRDIPYMQDPSGNIRALDNQQEPVKFIEKVDENGFITMIDPYTGRSFKAWDENTGQPVRAQERAQGMAATMMGQMGNPGQQQAQAALARRVVELQAIQNRMAKDGPEARAGLFRGTLQDQQDKLMAEIAELEVQAGGAMPAERTLDNLQVAAMPTATPTPSPTPQVRPQPVPQRTPQAAQVPLIARNPQTGETLRWDGSQWVPQ
jgi:hypothetical protein